MSPQKEKNKMNWKRVVKQIYDMVGTNTAIINKYGMILASNIKEFKEDKLISPMIWDLILQKKKVQKELNVEKVNSLVLETNKGNFVFTFAKYIYLMSIVPTNVNLSKYLPSINRIISTLDKSTEIPLKLQFKELELEKEYDQLAHGTENEISKDRYPIFKHLIKHIAKKQ